MEINEIIGKKVKEVWIYKDIFFQGEDLPIFKIFGKVCCECNLSWSKLKLVTGTIEDIQIEETDEEYKYLIIVDGIKIKITKKRTLVDPGFLNGKKVFKCNSNTCWDVLLWLTHETSLHWNSNAASKEYKPYSDEGLVPEEFDPYWENVKRGSVYLSVKDNKLYWSVKEPKNVEIISFKTKSSIKYLR